MIVANLYILSAFFLRIVFLNHPQLEWVTLYIQSMYGM